MKNLLVSVGLLGILLVCGLFVFRQTTEAQSNVTARLLALPAPPPPNPFLKNASRTRGEDFLSKTNPPKDEAPIEDVLEYWQGQSDSYERLGYNIKPAGRNLERILAEIEKKPETLTKFLNVLPESAETANLAKQFYDRAQTDESFSEEWKAQVKEWLTYHTDYFSDELLKIAQQVGDADEYVTHQEELLALTSVDWQKARPILERLIADDKQPVSQTLARWAFYRHALAQDDGSDIEKYRDQLKAVTENKSATAGMRDLAIDALVKEKEWRGRDEWYTSLLGDETLADLKVNGRSYTGLTTPIYYAPPGKYTTQMLELLGSSSAAVRSAAIRNLTVQLNDKNPEVVRALLPWLDKPDWAKDSGSARQTLISALANFTMPESVPGLIAVLNEKAAPGDNEGLSDRPYINANTVNRMSNSGSVAAGEYYPYRSAAIAALAKQKDGRAVSALRVLLPQVGADESASVVGALLACKGFSVAEQIEALESVAENVGRESVETPMAVAMTNGGARGTFPAREELEMSPLGRSVGNTAVVVNSMAYENYRRPFNPSDLKSVLGVQLAATTEVSDELVAALIDRIDYLDKRNAALALALRKIMLNWQGAAVNSLLLRDLKNGRADADAIIRLLSLRKELREKQSNDVFGARGGNSVAVGITACLLEDAGEYDTILAGGDGDAKTAMLACARLVRAALPVRKVAENLQSSRADLALAAERYLESEDSPEARGIVLSRHPNEARILGATTYFAADDKSVDSENNFLAELFTSVVETANLEPYYYLYDSSVELKTGEKKLQKEVRGNDELLGIYAYDGNFIRIYKDRADFSWETDQARYRERPLTESEFNRFKGYLSAKRADELPPFLSACSEECTGKELLMLGRQGGRRVFFKGDEPPEFFREIGSMFDELRKPPARLHYRLEKTLAGLEILFADDNLQAVAVWKNGDDFRVLINDPERTRQIEKELRLQNLAAQEKVVEGSVDYQKFEDEQRRIAEQHEFENLTWRSVEKNGTAGDAAAQPPQAEYIPLRDAFPARATNERWKSRTANIELRTPGEGLFKISRGQITKIRGGIYSNPVVSADGQWAVAVKYNTEVGAQLVRINLSTNKESLVKLAPDMSFRALAFVPTVNKFLIGGESYAGEYEGDRAAGKNKTYLLLDAAGGTVQPLKNEIRPLAQQTFRPLQAAARPDEFWAAIPDAERNETRVGIYNAKTFAFALLLKIPQIQFDSMDLWADEAENKIYFVYAGQLLGLPLPKKTK